MVTSILLIGGSHLKQQSQKCFKWAIYIVQTKLNTLINYKINWMGKPP